MAYDNSLIQHIFLSKVLIIKWDHSSYNTEACLQSDPAENNDSDILDTPCTVVLGHL